MIEQELTTCEPSLPYNWVDSLARESSEIADLATTWKNSQQSSAFAWADEIDLSAQLELRATARLLEIPYADELRDWSPSAEFIDRIPIGYARQHQVLGLTHGDETSSGLLLALPTLRSWQQIDVVSRFLSMPVSPVLAPVENPS